MAKQLPESAMDPRPRRVTLDSEKRCEEAFVRVMNSLPEGSLDLGDVAEGVVFGWNLCWRYLERQVQKEFIER